MDDKWFKEQQKKAGVTAEDIARKMGRDRSSVSHIYTGKRKMSLEWAQAFAETLGVSIDEVLKRAGALDEKPAQQLAPGFSDSDAVPFVGKPAETQKIKDISHHFGGARPGIDVWQVKSLSLSLAGYMPGDLILVDTHASELARAGDVVIAQKYDWHSGGAVTLLRRYEPPVLVAASPDPDEARVFVVDGNNIVIMGRVIASWRKLERTS